MARKISNRMRRINKRNQAKCLMITISLIFPGMMTAADDAAGAAFLDVYRVLMHPRCMNCHPIGNAPLQGDDSHPHAFRVQRGKDGKGVASVKCSNCHQPANQPGEHTPPGSPDPEVEGAPRWQLPPARSPLTFEKKSPQELCRQLMNQSKNGGMTRAQLLHHVEADSLVAWGFQPGEGRSTPPLTHAEFVSRFRAWLDGGASCPN